MRNPMEPLHAALDGITFIRRAIADGAEPWAEYESLFDRNGNIELPDRAEYMAALDAAERKMHDMISFDVSFPKAGQ